MHEVELVLISFFTLGATVCLMLYARTQKKWFPWAIFIMAIIPFSFSAIARIIDPNFYGVTGLAGLPSDFLVIPALLWIVAMVMLAKSDSETLLEKEYERIKALNDVARSYLAAGDIGSAATHSLERIAKTFDADGGAIMVIDRKNRGISVLATFGELAGEADEMTDAISERYWADPTITHAINHATPDVRKIMRELFTETFKKAGFTSMVGAPIRVGGLTTGMLALYSRRDIPLTKEGRDFLDLMAFELGLWMAQTSTVESMKKMTDTQKGLLEVSVGLQQELDTEFVVKTVADKLVKLIPSRDLMIYLYNPVKNTMWPAHALGKDASEVMLETEFPLSDAGLAGAILRSGKGEIIPDAMKDGRGRQVEGTSVESTALLAIPLIAKGEAVGIIELHRELPGSFEQEELEIASLFAQQASVAIQNARLLDEMEREKDKSKLYLDLLTHDIANLNTPLYSYFDMMIKDEKVDTQSKEMLRKAYAQVEKISVLLSRVRKLSKADLEEMEEQKICDPSEIIQQSVSELRRAFPSRRIDVVVKDLEGGVLVGAGEMLDEIFFNILHNSVKYSPKDVGIDITLEEMELEGRWFCAVRFCDYGTGVPDEAKPYVFEKPKAAAASFARGFGIGLSTCKKLIEKYGGSIWVEDRVEGDHAKGACFVVTLPLIREKSAGQTRKLK